MRSSHAMVMLLLLAAGTDAVAQERRSAAGGDMAPAPGIPGVRRSAAFPFAGVWHGLRIMEERDSDAFGLVFRVDSVTRAYVSQMILPNNHLTRSVRAEVAADALTFAFPNSGGGEWVYVARLAGQDSVVGTSSLRGAPFEGEHMFRLALARVKEGSTSGGK